MDAQLTALRRFASTVLKTLPVICAFGFSFTFPVTLPVGAESLAARHLLSWSENTHEIHWGFADLKRALVSRP